MSDVLGRHVKFNIDCTSSCSNQFITIALKGRQKNEPNSIARNYY